ARRTAAEALNMTRLPGKHAARGTWPFYTTARVTRSALTTYVGNGQKWLDISLGPLDKITGGGTLDTIATTGKTNNHIGSGYFNGDFNVFNRSTPVPTEEQAREVVRQTVSSPNACIVRA